MKKRAKYVTARKLTFFYFVFLILEINSYSQQYWTPTSINNAPSPRSWHTAVWTGSKMIIWGGQSAGIDVNTGGQYDISSNSWTTTSILNAPEGRELHTAIWTGSKMIVWGGINFTPFNFPDTGGVYDPETDLWTLTSAINSPHGRFHHSVIWTGSKMIIWGGVVPQYGETNTGGIYDPITNLWTEVSTVNTPKARDYHTAVWTGSKMIVWGGETYGDTMVNTGGIYDPILNSWVPTSTLNAPAPRIEHTAIWSGSKMIIWGGTSESGGIYDPVGDVWLPIATMNAPQYRYVHTVIWTGIKMIVWGGIRLGYNYPLNSGGIYDTLSDSWSPTSIANAPSARLMHTAIWTGTKMIIWGGNDANSNVNSGGIYYNPDVIGIENSNTEIPKEYNLYQNFPNPFNPITKIKYDLPKNVNVTVKVYDLLGREAAVLVNNEFKTAGRYEINWNAVNFASGVYIYRIQAHQAGSSTGDYVSTKKMVLVK